jgi:hypothetical protein
VVSKKKKAAQRAGRVKRSKEVKLLVESDQLLGEVRLNSSRAARLRLITYTGIPFAYVDLRMFWRGYDDEGEEVFHPSRTGVHLKIEDFNKLVRRLTEGDFQIPQQRPVN